MQRTLRDSAAARWTVLMIVAFTMMTGYIVAKEMSPLQYLLESPEASGGMGWTSSEFGIFAGARGFFNVFLLMLFVGGIILDKMGVRFAGVLSCVLMLLGSGAIYYAVAFTSPQPTVNVFHLGVLKQQVVLASLGFAFFGIGYNGHPSIISSTGHCTSTGRQSCHRPAFLAAHAHPCGCAIGGYWTDCLPVLLHDGSPH